MHPSVPKEVKFCNTEDVFPDGTKVRSWVRFYSSQEMSVRSTTKATYEFMFAHAVIVMVFLFLCSFVFPPGASGRCVCLLSIRYEP